MLEYIWRPVKTNEKDLKNNLSPRVGCFLAISRGLVSVHTYRHNICDKVWMGMAE